MRQAGILMPVASLPSEHGIGDFGKSSYEFIDMLKQCNMSIWQILPLNPLGYGNSPYQPYSSVAGDELYISLDLLYEEGLLKEQPEKFQEASQSIQYEQVRKFKIPWLKKAFNNFQKTAEYEEFAKQEWVYLYAVFLTFKKKNDLKCWNEWKSEHKDWIKDRAFDEKIYKDDIAYEMFIQYIFFKQWMNLKDYANKRNIKIMGDIPFYVGIDSLDVWTGLDNFLLDEEGYPTVIAGVPPDYFSATGQRWGNPIYDWEYLEKNKFDFWVNRIAYNAKLFDIIRIDHFRAFDTYWQIPTTCPTAIEGEWLLAPGYKVFDTIKAKFPDICIVAEDLGDLREEVYELRDHYKLPGMKIIQFVFNPLLNTSSFKDTENMITYTGTHDNQTIYGWYASQRKKFRRKTRETFTKLGYDKWESISRRFIRYAMDGISDYTIVPIQDVLGLGEEGRLNTPGTVGSPNWEWKLTNYEEFKKQISFLNEVTVKSKRVIDK